MAKESGKRLEDILTKTLTEHSVGTKEKSYLSTGSLLLDLALRDGRQPSGLPKGRVTEIYGAPASGKTSLALRVGREAQKQGGNIVFLDAERGLDLDVPRLLGVDLTPAKFSYAEPPSMDSCFKAIEEVVRAFHEEDTPTVIVVDSISALNPVEYTMDHAEVKKNLPAASGAKKLHQFFRRGVTWYLSGSNIVLILISHQTQNPRPYSPDLTPHGCAVEYYAHVRLRMTRKDLTDPEGGKRLGSWLNCTVKKSKQGALHQQVSFPWYYASGFSPAVENIAYLLGLKKLAKTGNGRIEFGGKSYLYAQLRELYLTDKHIKDTVDNMVIDSYLEERSS